MSTPRRDSGPDGPITPYVAKTRPCLRCKTPFRSAWAGERICPRCKTTNAWRSGAPARTGPERTRR